MKNLEQLSLPAPAQRSAPVSSAPPRRFGLPPWVTAAPFTVRHLALVSVSSVPVTTTALVLCAVNYFWRMFGVTGGYHRYFAHRSYKTSRPFQFLLAWLGCSALQKGPLWWAGHH